MQSNERIFVQEVLFTSLALPRRAGTRPASELRLGNGQAAKDLALQDDL